jgi:hypothetical protein
MVMRKHFRKIGPILIFSVLLFGGCDSLFSTPIGRILENPRDYADKTVTVSGEVREAFGLLFIKHFILKDDTGEIVVITDKPLPRTGAKMKVKGTVKEAFALGNRSLVVIVEKKEGSDKPS